MYALLVDADRLSAYLKVIEIAVMTVQLGLCVLPAMSNLLPAARIRRMCGGCMAQSDLQ